MRKKMEIANGLFLGKDAYHYWLEVQMPDTSCAAISLDSHSPLVNQVFNAWAKQTLENLEKKFLEQVEKQFEGETT